VNKANFSIFLRFFFVPHQEVLEADPRSIKGIIEYLKITQPERVMEFIEILTKFENFGEEYRMDLALDLFKNENVYLSVLCNFKKFQICDDDLILKISFNFLEFKNETIHYFPSFGVQKEEKRLIFTLYAAQLIPRRVLGDFPSFNIKDPNALYQIAVETIASEPEVATLAFRRYGITENNVCLSILMDAFAKNNFGIIDYYDALIKKTPLDPCLCEMVRNLKNEEDLTEFENKLIDSTHRNAPHLLIEKTILENRKNEDLFIRKQNIIHYAFFIT